MSVRKTFKTAAALLAGTVLSTAFAPSALAALNVGECVSPDRIRAEGQISVVWAETVSEGKSTGRKVRLSTDADGRIGYRFLANDAAGCYIVTNQLSSIKLNDPDASGLRNDLASPGSYLDKALNAGFVNGVRPIYQASIIAGPDAGNRLTVTRSASYSNGLVVFTDRHDQKMLTLEYYKPQLNPAQDPRKVLPQLFSPSAPVIAQN